VRLKTRQWGAGDGEQIVCVHGLAQHGGIYEDLGRRLAAEGRRVTAIDLRGHGDSGREPPWNTEAHVGDLLETADGLGIEKAIWIGHSFGGRMIAAVAAHAPERVEGLVLLDPGFDVPAAYALEAAEVERLDWSFASVDSAVNALLSGDSVVASPKEVVTAYAADDLRQGPDGRLRFSFSPAAAVVAWSEMTLPPPQIAQLPTLLVRPVASSIPSRVEDRRYRDALGSLLTMAAVPNGHNVLWESPVETEGAILGFLEKIAASRPA
jgi:pimeloyl-ACP methyl ester carboxylesterase